MTHLTPEEIKIIEDEAERLYPYETEDSPNYSWDARMNYKRQAHISAVVVPNI